MVFRNAISDDLPQIASLYRAAIDTPGCTWNENYPGMFELEHDFECCTTLADSWLEQVDSGSFVRSRKPRRRKGLRTF